ncbi:hypothetical protein C8R43DRAFT_1038842 [Mycena crocata]|nr:hypothetical protein C8R43DRAFT_1038842 [Mycena crocata]
MALLIANITVGQAATVINILIAFLQYTVGLAIVALLIYSIPAVNPALAWNVIGRRLHTSLWPTLLRTETARGTGFRVAFFSYLSLVATLLVAVAGVVMPLGLSVGPPIQTALKSVPAAFVQDTSPLGLATSPRQDYSYGRICGAVGPVTCPGTQGITPDIPPEVITKFNATPYGPFGMQFRKFYNGTAGHNYTMSLAHFSTTDSLILRNGIFAVDGLIVDLELPGIGLWNHTVPSGTMHGGVWSEDVLWLEPVSSCVDTNLTLDYTMHNSIDMNGVRFYNITDHGGFYNLTTEYPDLSRDGQNISLHQHAWKGAVLSNFYSMLSLNNMTRNQSWEGRSFPINATTTTFSAGKSQPVSFLFLGNIPSGNDTITSNDLKISCEGYGGADTANISNVAVHCGMFLGPPQRSDDGDPRSPADNSTWSQRLFGCAGGTRARMQRVEFSFNGTMDLRALGITRRNIDTPVLWATEKTDVTITNVDLMWGRVPDSLEGDPSLSTTRSDIFYVPAGAADIWGLSSGGQPSTLPAVAWTNIRAILGGIAIADYSGLTNYAVLRKFQELILADPGNGASRIQNMIWTDLMANNMMGSDTRTTLLVAENVPSTAYDLRYAIPALFVLLIWIPSLAGAVFVLITGLLKVSYLKYLINHTGAGRIALGDSALRPMHHGYVTPTVPSTPMEARLEDEAHWEKGAGRRPVWIDSAGAGSSEYRKGGFTAIATNER